MLLIKVVLLIWYLNKKIISGILSWFWSSKNDFEPSPLVQRPFRFWFWWTRLKPFEIHSRIYTKFLQSNEIHIRGPLFSKIHQRALSMLKNALNQKRTTSYTIKNLLLPQLSASEIFLGCTISKIWFFFQSRFYSNFRNL